jgi:hypothetical protein
MLRLLISLGRFMRRIKYFIVIIAAALILGSLFPAEAGLVFPDVGQENWYFNAVNSLYNAGIVSGFKEDGLFHPNDTLKASQFIKMLFYDTDIEPIEGEPWWMPYYKAGVEAKLLDPTVFTEAMMDENITRYQVAQLISGLNLKIDVPEGFKAAADTDRIYAAIADLDEIPIQYTEAVITVYAYGIMQGHADGSFHGDGYLTRAQAAQIVNKLFDEELRTPMLIYQEDIKEADDEWFADALILGNSLVGGLLEYGEIQSCDFAYCNGVSVFGLSEADLTLRDGSRSSLIKVLSGKTYGKIFLIFGTNEMSAGSETFYNYYSALIDVIRKYQSAAVIYVHNTPPVNEALVKYPEAINNENVFRTNEVIAKLAYDKALKLVDLNGLLSDAEGSLPKDATWDGVHFQPSVYTSWSRFLRLAALI